MERSGTQYEWIEECLLAKKGVSKDLKKEWNWVRFLLDDKMFAAVCLDEADNPFYITLKLEPSEGNVPDDLLKDMLGKSYQLVLSKMSKKKQEELLGE